jgi:hypothetical protein
MKVWMGLAAAAGLSVFMSSVAQAEVVYPYCSEGRGGNYGSGALNCSFVSMRQCEASAFGNGEWCHVNPRYRAGDAYRDDYDDEPQPRRRTRRRAY